MAQLSNGGGEQQQESVENARKNKIQVSNTKKPLFFYVNLSKRFMQQYEEVELSALGMAISTVVTVVEILKNNGLADVKSEGSRVFLNLKIRSSYHEDRPSASFNVDFSKFDPVQFLKARKPFHSGKAFKLPSTEIYTSTIDIGDEMRGRTVQKPKMEITLKKSDKFDEIMAAAANEENETDQYEQ